MRRNVFWSPVAILASALLAVPASAQDRQPTGDEPDLPSRIIEALRDRLQQEVTEAVDPEPDAVAPKMADGFIDFEDLLGPDGSSLPTALTDQYQKEWGVSFSRGSTVQSCVASVDEFRRLACPYPRAASGQRAAMHDIEVGPAMAIDFDTPVNAISLRINPAGGQADEEFVVRLTGFDANGNRVAASSRSFQWFQDAFTWPTVATLRGTGGEVFSRVSVELRRTLQNNQPVRFLIDDLAFEVAPTRAPVGGALAAQDGPPRINRAEIVQSPRVGAAQDELRIYPAATRVRVAIDWDAVDLALSQQSALGLAAVLPIRDGLKYVDDATLPLLHPAQADSNSLIVFGNRDIVNSVYRRSGRGYSVYASRLLTVVKPSQGAPGVRDTVTYAATEDGITGSFSLYGAAYSLTRHCDEQRGASGDPACFDRDAMMSEIDNLVVVVGATGRGRP